MQKIERTKDSFGGSHQAGIRFKPSYRLNFFKMNAEQILYPDKNNTYFIIQLKFISYKLKF